MPLVGAPSFFPGSGSLGAPVTPTLASAVILAHDITIASNRWLPVSFWGHRLNLSSLYPNSQQRAQHMCFEWLDKWEILESWADGRGGSFLWATSIGHVKFSSWHSLVQILSLIFKCIHDAAPVTHPPSLYLLQPLSEFLCSGVHLVLLCVLQLLFLSPWCSFHLPHFSRVINAFSNPIHLSGVCASATSAKMLPFILMWCSSPSCEDLQGFFSSSPKEVMTADLELHLPPGLWISVGQRELL